MGDEPQRGRAADQQGDALFVTAWDGWERVHARAAVASAPFVAHPAVDSDLFVSSWNEHLTGQSPRPLPARAVAVPVQRARRALRELVQTTAIAAIVFAITQTAVQGREVEGPSMEPTYHPRQKVLVNRVIYARPGVTRVFGWVPVPTLSSGGRFLFQPPDYGDVIVFSPPFSSRADLIKRVIGRPGDRITINRDGVFINGQLMAEPYIQGYGEQASTICTGRWCDYTLKADEFYVMGDNRGNSSDSRTWGPVRAGRIVGKAWFIYRPFSDFGPAP